LNESKLADTDLYKHYNPREPTHKSGSKMNGHKNSPTTPDFGNLHGRLPPAGLVKKLWKAVKWEEVERHVGADGVSTLEPQSRPELTRSNRTRKDVRDHSTSSAHTSVQQPTHPLSIIPPHPSLYST